MPKGGSKPGERRGGRQKGTPNKTTASVKAALQSVYDQRGGDAAFLAWSNENPTEFYKLWGRQLPHEVSGPDGGPIPVTRIERVIVDPAD